MTKLLLRCASVAVAIGMVCVLSTVQGATPKGNGGATVAKSAIDDDVVIAKAFLTALLSRDERTLRSFGAAFFEGGKLDKETNDFLYKADPKHKKRSIAQIAADGDLEIVLVRQRAGIVTVIYVPKQYRAGAMKMSFLEQEWMNKYFACEFDTTKPHWVLHYNFCFSETDGPYPAEGGGG
ncbi:hypothetical protein [Rhizomicrobium electricum]|uniref:Uncharacterized protein n=1 Tax=Rhizomicrobium electricum TaxID=480070 RepID=A0ABP3Q9S8_9PROT|nr:hypothetical protein [Rhizomicrobium electricum]NIJ50587.1 hypothetical protein [Rhizomicrobium electricum]